MSDPVVTKLTFQDMEESPALYVQGSSEDPTKVDNTHMHDNRYYLKAEVDSLLANEKGTGILSAGPGIRNFAYNGKADAQVTLDFIPISEDSSQGISTQPARADHYHQKLFTGHGFKEAVYDGSKSVVLELDDGVIGREALMSGPGIKRFTYTG